MVGTPPQTGGLKYHFDLAYLYPSQPKMPLVYREPVPLLATVPAVGTVPGVSTPTTLSTVPIASASPYQTYAPSTQGSVKFYQASTCGTPLSNAATPLIIGSCLNAPVKGIKGVSISTLPSCNGNGTPRLIVSNVANCGSSTIGSSADGGSLDLCQAFTSGADIGSVELVCVSSSLSKTSAATSTNLQYATPTANPYYTPPGYTTVTVVGYQPIPTVVNGGSGSSSYTTPPPDDDHGSCCSCSGCCCCCAVM